MPSRLGTLLGMKTSDLEKIIYYQDYVVIDAGDCEDLKFKQVLTEDEFRNFEAKYGNSFRASMGADAIRELIERTNLGELANQLRDDLNKTKSKQKIKDLAKRLKLVEQIRMSQKSGASGVEQAGSDPAGRDPVERDADQRRSAGADPC
jgi:DNA-directed RNA polymerase subunit beta'